MRGQKLRRLDTAGDGVATADRTGVDGVLDDTARTADYDTGDGVTRRHDDAVAQRERMLLLLRGTRRVRRRGRTTGRGCRTRGDRDDGNVVTVRVAGGEGTVSGRRQRQR